MEAIATANFFTQAQQEQIRSAILAAEGRTSGEIKVHLDKVCEGNVLDRAAQVFAKLGMDRTELRNGVLFYLAHQDRKFAILGDAGINAKVPDNFWDQIKISMQVRFRAGRFADGIIEGIEAAGAQLQRHFPHSGEADKNELSDDISYGKD